MRINKFSDSLTKHSGLFDFYFLFIQKIKRKSFKVLLVFFIFLAVMVGYLAKYLNITTFDPIEETARKFFLILIFIFSSLCYILVIFLINVTSSETIEEKNSRAMEIIISSLPARKHMFARIFSNFFLLIFLFLILLFTNFISTLIFCQTFDGIFAFLKKVNGIKSNASVFSLYNISGFKGNFLAFLICSLVIVSITCLTFLTFSVALSSIPSTAQDSQYLLLPLFLLPLISFYMLTSSLGSNTQTILGFIPLLNLCLFPSTFMFANFFNSSFDPYFAFLITLVVDLGFYFLSSFILTLIYQQGILNYSQKAAWVQFKEVIKNLTYQRKRNKK